MTRKKVDLTYIKNDSKRKTTLNKRKNGLVKKINEINILCGIEACAIIYTPDNPQPEVWPSDRAVQSVLSRLRTVSELEKGKKKLCQESFLRQRIIKAQAQLRKLRNEIRKKEVTLLMFQYLNANNNFDNSRMIDLNDISNLIDQNLEKIENNISMSQAQKVKSIAENGGETMSSLVNRVIGLETHVEAMQHNNLSMDLNNGYGDEIRPLSEVNVLSP
ncbi:agamous-like MADS-box protein AGL80 [Vigna radiata var. radiata]|uniref:Agamous-like MADS-box protein AGL80 n=1 Tax=Vigna radiata var. radiata TaxID=3916 RepID=A0A1S3VGJ1_VIGRR|nr:agamous-like MADS-box protein AGL80 [Vigna radiata var. radiata]